MLTFARLIYPTAELGPLNPPSHVTYIYRYEKKNKFINFDKQTRYRLQSDDPIIMNKLFQN